MSGERARSIRPQALFGLAAGAGCVLLALLGLELRSVAAGNAVPTRPLVAPVAPVGDAPSSDATATLPAGVVANATRVILARPLFSPQRRPPSVAVSGPQRPRLAAIIVGPNGRRAIFAGGDNSRGSVVGVGQQAGAWHVMAIDDTGVRVSGPDGVRVLHPSRDKAPQGGGEAVPGMPSHPSILDLLRSRNAPSGGGGGGLMGGRLPSLGLGEQQSQQQTAPAAPE